MEKINNPGVVIKRIKKLSFNVNESLVIPNAFFQSEIALQFGFSIESNLLDFTVDVYYHYPNNSDKLASVSVQNFYEVPKLQQFLKDGIIKLPSVLVAILVGMSISHTRAVFTVDLAGTKLNDSIMPVVDAEDVARHFFPLMFENTSKSKPKIPAKKKK
jgi:hypothetical protein